MIAKENTLRKIRILITNQFDSPEEAMKFFESRNEGKLRKSDLKKILRGAVETGFLKGFVANDLLKGYDKPSNDTISWEEFKVEIAALDFDY